MTFSLTPASLCAVVLDIEGTTTPIDFVYEVLFPFARTHVEDYLRQSLGSEELLLDLAKLRAEYEADVAQKLAPPPWPDGPPDAQVGSIVAYFHWLMDRDRKSTGLKSLQGKIWRQGYLNGELKGRVFPDVPPALERWRRKDLSISIFSSGSVLAQKLLFANSDAGDLTKFLGGYFDTTMGPKTAEASYRHIAAALRLQPLQGLFISDESTELDAAKSAGMQTALCVRPGNRPQPTGHGHVTIKDFSEVVGP